MISKKTHTKEWLDSLKNIYKRKDPALLEKSIKALTLLEGLQQSGMEFVFKGGTALLLLLKDLNRLSIDIDIIMARGDKLEEYLNKVVESGNFIKFEENIRKGDIPKSHYKFYYEPIAQTNKSAAYVLLDVLFEKVTYPVVKGIKLRSDLISTESPSVKIMCPDTNSILGDKLTAFAPNTTGINLNLTQFLLTTI